MEFISLCQKILEYIQHFSKKNYLDEKYLRNQKTLNLTKIKKLKRKHKKNKK